MSAEFSFRVDPDRDLVRVRMAGFFTPEDVAAFARARAEAHGLLRCPPNAHVTLNDVREMKIQPQETVEAFGRLLVDPAFRSRRLAFVAAPTLARSQLQRALAGRTDVRLFEEEAEARAWLFEHAGGVERAA